jgi:hypothetical protein
MALCRAQGRMQAVIRKAAGLIYPYNDLLE